MPSDSMPLSAPSSYVLGTTVSGQIVETEGTDIDDNNFDYRGLEDRNYWNFCGAGGAEVALSYIGWSLYRVQNYPPGNFTEPAYSLHHLTTYWKDADTDRVGSYATQGRAYLMWLAEYVQPPAWRSSGKLGIVTFSSYPGASYLDDILTAVNWESSAEGTNYMTYFWAKRTPVSSAQLQSDVRYDVYTNRVPTVVDVWTDTLPAWGGLHVSHTISIVGYNDSTQTYTYVDTCGHDCGSHKPGMHNGGTYTASYAQMWSAVNNFGVGYLY